MEFFDTPLDDTAYRDVRDRRSSGSSTTTPELTWRQKFTMVTVAVLSSFAVGSIPVVYAFTLAPTHNQTTTQTAIPRGEMF